MVAKRSDSQGSKRRGRPPKLSSDQEQTLLQVARENSSLSLDDLSWLFHRSSGIALAPATIERYLRANGFQRPPQKKRGVRKSEPSSQPKLSPYGYHAGHRDPGDTVRYPCGLTDAEWEQVQDLFDPPGRTGRPAKHSRRQVLDACIYVLRSGCSWRMLPKDFPHWTLVYRTFRRWQSRDLFEQLYDRLRKLWRSRERRNPDPTAIVLDSQSVKTSPQGGVKGYDGAKKIKGRKRHLVTDTLGLLIAVIITAASIPDRAVATEAVDLAVAKMSTLQRLYVDGGYAGCGRAIYVKHEIAVEVVRHARQCWHEGQLPLFETFPTGFQVLPKRWVIERTNAWNDRPRRLNKDHDRLITVSTGWIWLAESRRLLRRLTHEPPHA
jgi:transposase